MGIILVISYYLLKIKTPAKALFTGVLARLSEKAAKVMF